MGAGHAARILEARVPVGAKAVVPRTRLNVAPGLLYAVTHTSALPAHHDSSTDRWQLPHLCMGCRASLYDVSGCYAERACRSHPVPVPSRNHFQLSRTVSAPLRQPMIKASAGRPRMMTPPHHRSLRAHEHRVQRDGAQRHDQRNVALQKTGEHSDERCRDDRDVGPRYPD